MSIRYVIAWGAAILCLVPTSFTNVWPYTGGMFYVQGALVLIMAGMAFAERLVPTRDARIWCVFIGMGLLGLSFMNALQMSGTAQETREAPDLARESNIKAIEFEIAQYEKDRDAIPAHKITSKESVTDAQKAYDTADATAKSECKTGHGPNCEKDKAAVEALRKASKETADAYGLTVRTDDLNAKIIDANKRLHALGPRAKTVNPAAASAGRIVAVFSSKPDEAAVVDWWHIGWSFFLDLVGYRGPILMLLTFGIHIRPMETPHVTPQNSPASPATKMETAAAVPAKSPRKRREVPKTDKTKMVKDWMEERTRPGIETQCGPAHDDFVRWCVCRKHTPLSLAAFGKVMRDEIKVSKVKRSGYWYYVGIALTERPAFKVVSG